MANFRSRIYIEVPCTACNEPQLLSAESIVEGRRLAAEGCSGAASYECPVQQFVPFGAPQLEALERVLEAVGQDKGDQNAKRNLEPGV